MKNHSFGNIVDGVLSKVAIFMLSFFWVRYYTTNLTNILFASVTITLCITALIGILKKRKKKMSKAEIKNMNEVFNQFIFNDTQFAIDTFHSALKQKHPEIKKYNNMILIKTKKQTTAFFPYLTASKLTTQEFTKMYSSSVRRKCDAIVIATIEGAETKLKQSMEYLEKNITVLNGEKVYKLLKSLESLPEIKIKLEKKRSFFLIFSKALSKDKTRKYIFIAIVLLISSYFVRYSIYYIVIASICIVLSLLCYIDIVELINRKKAPTH